MSEDIKIPFELVTLNGEPFIDLPVSGSVRPILPWRKPEERPEEERDYLWIGKHGKYLSRYSGNDRMWDAHVRCWLYPDELPLPTWAGEK